MRDALDRSEVHGVVLAGEPGVGKTRLAQECLELAQDQGLHTEWVVGTHSSSAIPFGAFAHLLPEQLLSTEQTGGDPQAFSVLAAGGRALAERAPGVGLVLGVDDAHLLDGASASLLQHLAITGAAFVVAAMRSGAAAPDAVAGLWKDQLAERVEVQPLSRAEVDVLVESALGGQVEVATLYRLFETTRGNSLFLRELVLGGLQAGSLVETGGVWRWSGPFAPAPRLLDVLQERLGRLAEPERNAVEIVAEAEHVSAGILEQLAELEAVEALERRGILESWSDGHRTRLRLAHPLYGEAIRALTPPLRARSVRRSLADAVQQRGARRREDLLRVATWRLEAGDRQQPELAVAASRRAALASDFELAARLAQAGLESAGGHDAAHALADALIGQGQFAQADDVLREFEAQPLTEAVRARLALVRATNLFWRMGQGEAAWETLRRAEEAVADPALRDEVAGTRATFLVFGGRTSDGIRLGLDVVDRAASDRAVAQAAPTAWGLNVAGRPEQTRALIARVGERADAVVAEFPILPSWLGISTHLATFVAGDLDEAAAGLESRYRSASEQGSFERTTVAWALAWVERIRGRVRTARRRLAEAVPLLREVDMLNHLPLCLAELAHAAALLGDVDAAAAALAEAEERRLAVLRAGEGHFGLARIWVAAAGGERSRAVHDALETAQTTGEMGHVVFASAALHDVARLGAAVKVVEPLDEMAREACGPMIPAYAAHARALAEADPQALERTCDAFATIGANLYAAEAAGAAAMLFRQQGRTGSALAAAACASRLASACEGARTPILDQLEFDLPLTPREREIATLAARGLSNKNIADRLVISLRTVENHLSAAYDKLGIDGREELAPILGSASATVR